VAGIYRGKMTETKKKRYIEEFPDKIERDFTYEEYYDFFKKRFNEVSERLDFCNPLSKYKYSDWKYKTFTLNKNGVPRRPYYPNQLMSSKVREKQQRKFQEYLQKKREEIRLRNKQEKALDEGTYAQAIKILIDNKIDLNRLDIRVKRRY